MSDFIFRISPNIILGSYTTSRLGQFARDFGSKFMIIIDPILKEVGLSDKILQSLIDRKIDFFTFNELTEGASTKTIQQALSLARNAHIHGVIAIGGSKTIQVARAVSAYYNEIQDLYTFIDGSLPSTAPLPLICVPTTPRALFVFTDFIPIVDSRSLRLTLLKIQPGLCKLVLFDPNLTVTLTENQSEAMSLEVLCLTVESYISPKASFFSDMLVEKSVQLLGVALNNSQSLVSTTPLEVLITQSGCMVSLGSSSSSIGPATLLAMCVNSRFKISRSLITSILFPYVIEDAANYKTDRIVTLANLFNHSTSTDTPENIVSAFSDSVRQRLAKSNLPTRLKDLSISIEQLALAAEDAGNVNLISSLPRSMTTDDLFDLIKLAY